MIIPTYTASGQSCIGAKRIYSDVVFKWVCPECQEENHTNFDGCPLSVMDIIAMSFAASIVKVSLKIKCTH